jgi:type II secretory pathway pseudopilin PulG
MRGRTEHELRPSVVAGVRLGIGLVEAAVATVIVGIMLVSALATFDATIRARKVTTDQTEAAALASLLMNEILSRRYEEPVDPIVFGREGAEALPGRADWDDVDDYHGFSQSPPADANGIELPGKVKWTWQASVALADPADPNRAAGSDVGLKRITVTVTDPKGVPTTWVALRSRGSPRDRPVSSPISFVGHVGIHLEVGGGANGKITSGTNLLNEPAP